MPDFIHCVGIYVTPAINKQSFSWGSHAVAMRLKVNFMVNSQQYFSFSVALIDVSKLIEKEMCAIYVTVEEKKVEHMYMCVQTHIELKKNIGLFFMKRQHT